MKLIISLFISIIYSTYDVIYKLKYEFKINKIRIKEATKDPILTFVEYPNEKNKEIEKNIDIINKLEKHTKKIWYTLKSIKKNLSILVKSITAEDFNGFPVINLIHKDIIVGKSIFKIISDLIENIRVILASDFNGDIYKYIYIINELGFNSHLIVHIRYDYLDNYSDYLMQDRVRLKKELDDLLKTIKSRHDGIHKWIEIKPLIDKYLIDIKYNTSSQLMLINLNKIFEYEILNPKKIT